MLSSFDFVRQSLELHLFFARIMKEHSFFLEAGFTTRDNSFTRKADEFRMEFDRLLIDVVSISNGIVSQSVIHSGEVFTPYTLDAETVSSYYSGVRIPINITQAEINLMVGETVTINPFLEQRVVSVNNRAIGLIKALITFKETILSNVLSCKMFTLNYPLLIDHIMREARLYVQMVQQLQSREEMSIEKEALQQELFWNRIMAEHSKFIRGLLDPTEDQLINTAHDFGNEFDQLTTEAKAAVDMTIPLEKVTEDSLNAVQRIRDFKEQGTRGLLECKIKSIIIPLLGDHTLREANHFLRLLKQFEVKPINK